MSNRREFLKKTGLLSLSALATGLMAEENIRSIEKISFIHGEGSKIVLPPLPYDHAALEPHIDKRTMEIHHGKHHQGYIDKLNTASEKQYDFKADPADNCRKVDEKTDSLVRNNLGGHYNHSLFWTIMKPNSAGEKNEPSGKMLEEINKCFKSFEEMKKEFTDKASKQFGSGWCWLIVDEKKNMKITTTPNQDNPLMKVAQERGTPILGLDVWEHAYYLKYQNKRADYISGWWNIVNWEKVAELYSKA